MEAARNGNDVAVGREVRKGEEVVLEGVHREELLSPGRGGNCVKFGWGKLGQNEWETCGFLFSPNGLTLEQEWQQHGAQLLAAVLPGLLPDLLLP